MSLSTHQADFVRDLVYRRSAIVLDETKHYLIQARLESLAVQVGYQSVGELLTAAQSGTPDLHTRVVEALTTNETSFFRDRAPFECLRKDVLPKVVNARASKQSLTIWCAACSTGQEPYSIAMMIDEHFPQLRNWSVKILATDISDQVLERARSGKFQQLEVNRGLPATLLVKYFTRIGNQWQIKQELRDVIEFSNLNLIGDWRLPRTPDIVFIRNVLIYFDVETKRGILQRIRKTMSTDGALFLGAAETTLNVDPHWERVSFENTSYYRMTVNGVQR